MTNISTARRLSLWWKTPAIRVLLTIAAGVLLLPVWVLADQEYSPKRIEAALAETLRQEAVDVCTRLAANEECIIRMMDVAQRHLQRTQQAYAAAF
jgi:hypothetical protein